MLSYGCVTIMQHKINKTLVSVLIVASVLICGFTGYYFLNHYQEGSQNDAEKAIELINISQITENGIPHRVHIENDMLYTLNVGATQGNSLNLYDASDPSNLHLLGTYWTPHLVNHFSIHQNLIYITTVDAGLEIVNITDFSNIEKIGEYTSFPMIYGIQVIENYAFMGCFDDGFQIMDISNASEPTVIATRLNYERCVFIVINENICYVTSQYGKITSFDISNPSNPVFLDSLYLPDRIIWDPTYHNGMIFAGDHDDNDYLLVINASDPTDLQLIREFDPGLRVNSVMGLNNTLFCSTVDEGILVLDISNIDTIKKIGEYNNNGSGFDIAITNSHVFYPDSSKGLIILQINKIS